jgi:competence protein ComEA
MKLFRILPVLALALVGPLMTAQAKPAAKTAAKATATTAPTPAPVATKDPLDINTASPDQLMALPGIGQAYGKRIIDGRPYTAKNQLLSRGILPKATYEGVASQIIAKKVAK